MRQTGQEISAHRRGNALVVDHREMGDFLDYHQRSRDILNRHLPALGLKVRHCPSMVLVACRLLIAFATSSFASLKGSATHWIPAKWLVAPRLARRTKDIVHITVPSTLCRHLRGAVRTSLQDDLMLQAHQECTRTDPHIITTSLRLAGLVVSETRYSTLASATCPSALGGTPT